MPQIRISIQNKIARAVRRDGCIVCGNGDYEILFSFDAEWDPHKEKVARFIWDGGYFDVPFEGDVCPVPCITSAPSVEVGVYAGTLRTTTPAVIRCRPSIRSDVTLEIKPEAVEQFQNLAQAAASEAKGAASEARAAAVAARSAADEAEASVTQLSQEWQGISQEFDQVKEASASASQCAADIAAHAAAQWERHAFVVGTESEQAYMTADSTGIYSVSGAFRHNDYTNYTVYRYPISHADAVTSAIWHAHLAQQVRLEASADGESWVVLQDTAGANLGTQYHYELCDVLSLAGAEAIYIRLSDSNATDGSGGAILADIPVTLDLIRGKMLDDLLPPVTEANNGAYLRVIDGKWKVADATALASRVRTYIFKVGEESELKYLVASSTGHTNETCRFNDQSRYTIYRYRIANAALVRRVLWTAMLGQQLKLECSSDGENWTVLYDSGTVRMPFTRVTYDLTEHLNLLAFDEIYLRISDSDPSDGFGGAISKSKAVELHIERCEPPIGF